MGSLPSATHVPSEPLARIGASPPELSVVVPAYNEAGSIAALIARVQAALAPTGIAYELVLVDDGSGDATWPEIVRAAQGDPSVRGLRLARNFGHQHALLAGLAHARGRAIVTMDADLQHPPELIPELHRRWRDGARVVRTVRRDHGVATPFKRLSSRWFYRLFSGFTGLPLAEGSSDFRLVDATVRDELLRFRDRDVFLRGNVQWLGYAAESVEFDVAARHAGASSYSLARMLRFASGAVVSFSTRPLRFGIWLGGLTAVASLAELAYVVVQYFRGRTVPGWASITGVMSLLFAVLFILLGIIGIYIARIHEVLQNRPAFVVAETTHGRLDSG
ncbi:MAG TPA: glycosyltransferase family 2 protein [Gemmatimonadaceae bacterium]|nr:glycosyltransferase family 2 protein [Gemmatimonadaceae bacterium]